MPDRMKKVNSLVQQTFGEILLEEADVPNDVMVTISKVDTAANLQSTTVWLYIFPLERADEVLDQLKPQMYDLQGAFNRAVHLKPLPRIYLKLDHGAEHADTIERRLAELKEDGDED